MLFHNYHFTFIVQLGLSIHIFLSIKISININFELIKQQLNNLINLIFRLAEFRICSNEN